MKALWSLLASRLLVAGIAVLFSGAVARANETFEENIDGKSEVTRNMPGCVFAFKEKIDGESMVSIRGAGGTIDFPNRHNLLGDGGSRIDGKSKVLLEAETIKFNAKVDGKSVVLIIISKGGTLELLETNGQVEVYWRKADPKDPAATVKPGKIDNAKVKQVEREELDKLIKQHGLNELRPALASR